MTGLVSFFFAESNEDLILLFDRELLEKDLFLDGVSKFLNLQRYISLYPLSVRLFYSAGSWFWMSP